MEQEFIIRTYSKRGFSALYLIDWRTIKSTIREVDEMLFDEINSRKRILTPRVVEKMFKILGTP